MQFFADFLLVFIKILLFFMNFIVFSINLMKFSRNFTKFLQKLPKSPEISKMLGIIGVTGFPNDQLFRIIDNWGWGFGPEVGGCHEQTTVGLDVVVQGHVLVILQDSIAEAAGDAERMHRCLIGN